MDGEASQAAIDGVTKIQAKTETNYRLNLERLLRHFLENLQVSFILLSAPSIIKMLNGVALYSCQSDHMSSDSSMAFKFPQTLRISKCKNIKMKKRWWFRGVGGGGNRSRSQEHDHSTRATVTGGTYIIIPSQLLWFGIHCVENWS